MCLLFRICIHFNLRWTMSAGYYKDRRKKRYICAWKHVSCMWTHTGLCGTWMRTYNTYNNTHTRNYTHTLSLYTYIHTYTYTHIHTYTYTYDSLPERLYISEEMCVCMYMSVCMRVHVTNTNIQHTYVHIHNYMNTYMLASTHALQFIINAYNDPKKHK